MLYRVIRGQGGASLKFYGKSNLGDFQGQNVESEKSNRSFESAIVFLPSLFYLIGLSISNLKSMDSRSVKVGLKIYHVG